MTGVVLRLCAVAGVVGVLLGDAGVAPARHLPASAASPTAKAKAVRPLRVQVLAHADPGGGFAGDVVAHRGYAYLSSWHGANCSAQGVRIYDLRDPRRPVRAGTFADADSDPAVAGAWTEKTIVRSVRTPSFSGDLAVTSFQTCKSGGFRGFGLYDVTNPSQPRKLALVPLDPNGSHEIWLAAARNHAWVYTAVINSELRSSPDYDPQTNDARTPGEPDFRIYDVTDPGNPVKVGGWGAWRALGAYPRSGRGRFQANFVHSVITNSAATRAFLSYWDLGTVILDISNPARPRYLGRTPAVDGEGDAHSSWLARGGKVLIETHENAVGRPFFFDISNPRRPRLLSRFGPVATSSGGFTTGVHDPKVLGNRAYFSWYSRGVLVADISNLRRPRLVARFVPTPERAPDGGLGEACSSTCTLVWGVFPTRNYVLASDMVSGLWILRLR